MRTTGMDKPAIAWTMDERYIVASMLDKDMVGSIQVWSRWTLDRVQVRYLCDGNSSAVFNLTKCKTFKLDPGEAGAASWMGCLLIDNEQIISAAVLVLRCWDLTEGKLVS